MFPTGSPEALLSMMPADVISDLSAAETAETSTTEVETQTDDTPETSITDPEPIGETQDDPGGEPETVTDPETPPVDPKTAVPAAEDLPEGVISGKGKDGKPLYFVDPDRWKNSIYPNHQLVQQASQVIGEPLTMGALQDRQLAFMNQERMFTDLNSGDPTAQKGVLDFILGDMARAVKDGEVGVDPAVPLAQTFYQTLREKSPDAYANLRFSAARDLLSEMFGQASRSNDASLFSAAQHFARTLAGVSADSLKAPNGVASLRATAERMGIPFHVLEEMPSLARGADPNTQLREQNQQLRAQLDGRQTTNQAEQFGNWQRSTNQAIATGINEDAIKPALASVADAWKPFPAEYQDLVVDRLNKQINATIGADGEFKERIRLLTVQAQRATSQQVRDRITSQIKQAYTHRAQQAADAHKRPILTFAAKWLSERSASNNARRAAGQDKTTPRGATSAVPRSLVPDNIDKSSYTTNGVFDPAKAGKLVNSFLPR